MHTKLRLLLLIFIIGFACSSNHDSDDPTPQKEDNKDSSGEVTFSEHIQPILSTHCVNCHGNSGGISLSNYSGVKAVVDNGRLLKAIKHEDGVSPMPKDQNKLSDEKIELIESWVNTGAPNN
ncbi:cytochrome c [Limibacter armeniacum]|uniref:c-type cytochrome n=1 Tax=Limibacter armeniacum TaxID=466084 RepID=UPI002FE54877